MTARNISIKSQELKTDLVAIKKITLFWVIVIQMFGVGVLVLEVSVHVVVVSKLVSMLLVNTRILSLRMRQQQLHGYVSPQQDCQLLPKTHWLDPTIRLR